MDGNILSSHYISDFEKISEEAEDVKGLLDSTSKEIKKEITELENKFDKVIEEGGVTPEVIVARNGEHSLNNRLDNMDKRNQDRAIISFTFDDSFFEDRLTYNIFKEYELACTFAVILDRVLTYN
ncbi:hypothetical protein [Bacillus toyonensis]|uniref:hypothetical protein n=1 Tax=Bacillus toyonensis TaxID=155322 RepID=UPI00211D9C1A|nr:hypothetical protein [Bacillus toyonensis]